MPLFQNHHKFYLIACIFFAPITALSAPKPCFDFLNHYKKNEFKNAFLDAKQHSLSALKAKISGLVDLKVKEVEATPKAQFQYLSIVATTKEGEITLEGTGLDTLVQAGIPQKMYPSVRVGDPYRKSGLYKMMVAYTLHKNPQVHSIFQSFTDVNRAAFLGYLLGHRKKHLLEKLTTTPKEITDVDQGFQIAAYQKLDGLENFSHSQKKNLRKAIVESFRKTPGNTVDRNLGFNHISFIELVISNDGKSSRVTEISAEAQFGPQRGIEDTVVRVIKEEGAEESRTTL
jgi:hypothetical protein